MQPKLFKCRTARWACAVCAAILLSSGCSKGPIAKGVLYSVSYKDPDGKVHGFTRLNSAAAVPGGNGSWNVDAYGELTPDFLIVTRPQRPDLGPQVIPVK